MRALAEVGVPVPRILAVSSDPVIDGRPYVLMERVHGVGIEAALANASPRELVTASFAAARRLHEVPAARTGIGDEKPISAEEEVQRWQALRVRAPAELVAAAPRLEERLLLVLPAQRSATLIHGDYHLGNLLFRGAEVAAILDWEIAGLGQPDFDEAALCLLAIRAPFGEPQPGSEAALPLDEMVELAATGNDFDWYLAATCHKYASILGYILSLHRRGRRIDPLYEQLTTTIPRLIDVGLSLVS
jgi:aminoglycoside phosphotransferase (APT) family kinase protein